MKIEQVESKLTENSQEMQQVVTKLFSIGEKGYTCHDFFIDEECTTERSVGSMFFPYCHFNGDMKVPLYTKNQNGQVVKWVPFVNNRITNFLEGQASGCTDLFIPLCTNVDDIHYVYTQDGASCDSLVTFVKGQQKKADICKLIVDFHLGEEDDEEDEDY